jgi:peptidoglycan/LPS O-acetylase OafA/YrhL
MKDRQPELDYLRGLACLMVLFFHYLARGPKAGWTGQAHFPWAEGVAMYGHYGVQLFFMISGFVIYKSATGRTVGAFAKARFWRLYPAYWVGILITTAFVLLTQTSGFQVSLRDFLWNFTMFQSWAKAKSVDGAYWSLMVEMLFYIYIGIAIYLGLIRRTYLIVSGWLMICALNVGLRSFWIDTLFLAQWGAFFSIGILCYRLREGDKSPLLKCLLLIAILLACLRTYVDISVAMKATATIDIVLVLFLSLFFVFCVYRPSSIKSSRYSNLFGDLTYPVYLVHQFAGYILMSALVLYLGSVLSLICTVILVLAIGFVMNQMVEKRLVGYLKLRFSKPLMPEIAGLD